MSLEEVIDRAIHAFSHIFWNQIGDNFKVI